MPETPTSATTQRAEKPEISNETWIDWGPALPETFTSGRARLLVVNPNTLHLSWETAADSPLANADAWVAEVRIDGGILLATWRVEGSPGKHTHNCWMTVDPKTHGFVRLLAVQNGQMRRIADLGFETPPAGPSTDFTERWGSLDRLGSLRRDESAVLGNRVEPASNGPSPYSATRPATAPND